MTIFDGSKSLIISNAEYQKALEFFVWQAYMLDLGKKGDLTTHTFIQNPDKNVSASLIAKESGILAGVQEAEWFLRKVGIKILKSKSDGDKLNRRDLVMELSGKALEVLAAERTLLNLLQRMSGIATATHHLKSILPKNIELLATRKTFWAELDKRAVAIGGGLTHRLNLGDAILIKENHMALSDGLTESLDMVLRRGKSVRFIEVEVESLKELKKLLSVLSGLPKSKKLAVMLDNFTPANIRKAVELSKNSGILIEVSGGINERNIKKYAIKGVDAISSGAITNKAKALDISLRVNK